jgi:curved DNA-binding protein CbpA
MTKNHYTVLGLPQNATSRQIRERFLELARERHPDRFQGPEKEKAELDFQEVTQAFNVLSDPNRRRQLDAELARPDYSKQTATSSEAARVYIQRGTRAFREGSFSQAVDNFERATEEDPDSAKAWYHLAVAGRELPRWRLRARKAVAKACELDPMNSTYLKLAGRLFAETGMQAQAVKYLRQALDWGGEDPEVEKELQAAIEAAKKGGASSP